MFKVNGVFVGAGVVPPEQRRDSRGQEYTSKERYVIAVGENLGSLPQFHDCEPGVLGELASLRVGVGDLVELTARRGPSGRPVVTAISKSMTAALA